MATHTYTHPTIARCPLVEVAAEILKDRVALEEITGGREDIWYATNIEIIDYMEILKNLKFSGNGEAVYNPSAQSAWLQVDDGCIVEVKGGAYVDLAK